ncbi:MAG TPA: D-2-hydroxyacid dehydrogenase [Victivallales bacterium]|nr:D-2-hydroxyacid dehydrogenase [Victivallales bacterium]
MNIVILDGYTTNPGDLSWSNLNALGKCTIYDRTKPSDLIERSKNAEVIITNKVVLSKEILLQLPKLKFITVLATGYNIVDIKAASELNISVANVPEYSTKSVAQITFAHILNFCHHIESHSSTVRNGDWSNSKDFCYWNFPLIELTGKKLGVIGFGKIGREVLSIAKAFNMNVLINNRSKIYNLPENVVQVDIETIFKESDYITLHCPLTEGNKQFINSKLINLMNPTAYLINTSRGGLINESDLADALNSNKIAGAGLDVLSEEPPVNSSPLIEAKNCYITPHIAWATFEAREKLIKVTVENVRCFIKNNPQNVVN